MSGKNTEELDIEIQDEAALSLKTKSELSKDPAIKVKLHYVNPFRLEVTKGGRVQSADTLIAEVLQLDAVNGGKGRVECIGWIHSVPG